MTTRIYDPDSIKPGIETIGVPPRPVGVPDEEAYEVEIIRNPDGTQLLTGASNLSRALPSQVSVSFPPDGSPGVLTLAPRDAAMVGLFHMLENLTWTSFNLQEVVERKGPTITTRRHKLTKIHLDWPDTQKESMPAQTALITGPDPGPFDSSGFTPRLEEETLGRFMPGTVLRYLGVQEIPLSLVIWTAHKDQRRGLEAKLVNLFAAEPRKDIGGRRIIVPEYFSRTVRYTLVDDARPDSAEGARAGEWILDLSITAECDIVELVRIPGIVEGIETNTETS